MPRVRIEYWRPPGQWEVGHANAEIPNPARYIVQLAKNAQRAARATDLETGEVHTGPCPVCEDVHPEPFDGSCLL